MEVIDMSFWDKLRAGFFRFMQGRNGVDQLGNASMWTAVVLTLINVFANSLVLSLLVSALWIWAIFRLLSRNVTRRRAENAWFSARFYRAKTLISQARERFKNRKKYVYFECPNCHLPLRLPRGVGNVTVKCSKCGHTFDKKA